MAFTLREATCTALGSFNIYIFRPDWVAGRRPPPDEGEEEDRAGDVAVDFARPGVRVRFPSRRLQWTVRPDMLVVSTLFPPAETGGPPPDCGGLVAGVLRELPRTPLHACGNTYRFAAPAADCEAGPLGADKFAFDPTAPPGDGVMRSRGFGCVVDQPDGVRLSLSVTRFERSGDGPEVLAVVNFHREEGDAERCAAHADRFLSDYAAAASLIRSRLAVEVSDGPSST